MDIERVQRNATAISILARAALALAITATPACTTATAAGCGVGIAAGVALAGIAAASSKGSVNAGTAMVGGGLFGIASGCSAAGVAEGITQKCEKYGNTHDYAPIEPHAAATQAPITMKRSDDVVTTQADLVGIKLVWVGSPPVKIQPRSDCASTGSAAAHPRHMRRAQSSDRRPQHDPAMAAQPSERIDAGRNRPSRNRHRHGARDRGCA